LAQAAAKESNPGSDIHGTAEYRRHLAGVLLARVLQQAAQEASQAKS
jgi:CO/xanthine dehydrogenase FAD-binding subunit